MYPLSGDKHSVRVPRAQRLTDTVSTHLLANVADGDSRQKLEGPASQQLISGELGVVSERGIKRGGTYFVSRS